MTTITPLEARTVEMEAPRDVIARTWVPLDFRGNGLYLGAPAADAILTALGESGMVVVPKVATDAMVKEMHDGPLGAFGEVPTAQANEWLREMWCTAVDAAAMIDAATTNQRKG